MVDYRICCRPVSFPESILYPPLSFLPLDFATHTPPPSHAPYTLSSFCPTALWLTLPLTSHLLLSPLAQTYRADPPPPRPIPTHALILRTPPCGPCHPSLLHQRFSMLSALTCRLLFSRLPAYTIFSGPLRPSPLPACNRLCTSPLLMIWSSKLWEQSEAKHGNRHRQHLCAGGMCTSGEGASSAPPPTLCAARELRLNQALSSERSTFLQFTNN